MASVSIAAKPEPISIENWATALVIHPREGHRPDLSDAPKAKVERGTPTQRIGAPGPVGCIQVRGEPGHDLIPALCPAAGEPVIDQPGKGALHATDRGFRCIVPSDCCGSCFPEFHAVGLRMIQAQGGIFGWVTDSTRILAALRRSL